MPAVSKSQQAAMGMALAARRGEMKVSELKGAALELYKSDISNKDLEDFASTKRDGLPKKKKSLKEMCQDSLLGVFDESILDSTKTGKEGLKERTLEWLHSLDSINVKFASGEDIRLFELFTNELPDFLQIKHIYHLCINNYDAKKTYTFPEDPVEVFHIIDSDLKDLSFTQQVKANLVIIDHCNIRSIKGISKDVQMYLLGNNTGVHPEVKEVHKLTGLKPDCIRTMGELATGSRTGINWKSVFNSIVMGMDDEEYKKEVLKELETIAKKEIPALEYLDYDRDTIGWSSLYFYFQFTKEGQELNGIKQNSVYLGFKYDIQECSLEFKSQGHIALTDADRAGKYKYLALKGLSAPYTDNGGKLFRKTRIYDFNTKNLADKLIPWIKDVVDAALKDQGGNLNKKR